MMKKLTFIFCCFLLLSNISLAQQPTPQINQYLINQLKANATEILNVDKQILPLRDKLMIRFGELGKIYNPHFPETRNQVRVFNFKKSAANFTYIGKSISTFRATVFLRSEGTYYGVWDDQQCVSLIEYDVTRVGDKVEVTGIVYTNCLSES